MSKQKRGPTFADIVRDVEEHPVPPLPDTSGVVDPSGARWHVQVAEISPARALQLAVDGAVVAWDRCGCGGYCGFDWYGPDEVATLVAAGTPTVRCTKRHQGNLSEWGTADGRALVVAEQYVRWGDIIDG